MARPLVLVGLDAEPGAAQRLFARFAARAARLSLDGAKAVVTGTPLRERIVAGPFAGARDRGASAIEPPIDAGRRSSS